MNTNNNHPTDAHSLFSFTWEELLLGKAFLPVFAAKKYTGPDIGCMFL